MSDEKKVSFFDAPPQTMFVFGLVCGIALTLLVNSVLGSGIKLGGNNDGGNNAPVVTTPTNNGQQPQPAAAAVPKVTKEDWIKGDIKAKVQVIEYSDLQCPYCGRHNPTILALEQKYGDKIAVVYRHFPLTSIHPEAQPAALASECVGEQKGSTGFFSFIDTIYANQDKMNAAYYETTAQALGVNMDKFKSCVSSQKYLTKVNDQQQGGAAAGVQATPTTIVAGQMVSGADTLAKFTAIIDSALAGK